MIFAVPEQFIEFNKSSLETALQFAKLSLDAVERMTAFSLGAGREALADAAKQSRALTEVKDIQDLVAWRTQAAEAGVEKVMSYSKNAYELAQHTQSEVSALVEARMADVNKNVGATLDKAMKAAPAGADVVVAAIKSTVAATSATIDSMTKATKQALNFADASVKATANATAAAAKTGRK